MVTDKELRTSNGNDSPVSSPLVTRLPDLLSMHDHVIIDSMKIQKFRSGQLR